MIFYFASIFESGQIVERESYDSATFDRDVVTRYRQLIDEGEDFGEDLSDVHLEWTTTGAQTAIIEVSSGKGDLITHLLGATDGDAVSKELHDILTVIHNPGEPVGNVLELKARPLALCLLPSATDELRALSRYPIALAAAFFEAISVT